MLKKGSQTTILLGVLIFSGSLALIGLGYWLRGVKTSQRINSFEACVRAGYPVLESQPLRCLTPDGQSFAETEVELESRATPVLRQKRCGIENCHGLDIKCGPNAAQSCTMMYVPGDRCRQHAQCGIVNGECQQIESEEFDECKACVEACWKKHAGDSIGQNQCESECG